MAWAGTCDEVPQRKRECAGGEDDLQPDQAVSARVQLNVDVLLRVLDVFPCPREQDRAPLRLVLEELGLCEPYALSFFSSRVITSTD